MYYVLGSVLVVNRAVALKCKELTVQGKNGHRYE